MSIKFKIPLIMLTAFLLNIIVLMAYYQLYLSDRVELYQKKMEQAVSEAAEGLAAKIEGQSFAYASETLTSYENSRNFVLTLKNTRDGQESVWNPQDTHRLGFTKVKLVSLADAPYMFQVHKQIEILNLKSHSVLSQLLYFEIAVLFVMFLLVGVLIHFRYVTALLKLDWKMKRYQSGEVPDITVHGRDEIGQLEASFVELAQTLSEEKQTQNRIIASISHDIKTPLTSVMGYSERIAKKELPPEKQRQYIKIIYNQARDIEAIVDEFDEYLSTTVSGNISVQEYEVRYLCEMLKDEYLVQLKEQDISFSVRNDCAAHIAVQVDLLKLRRMFANIIGNSIRHAGVQNLSIEVDAKAENGQVLFTVSDNGRGVSDADLPHIFEPFYTSDKSRRVSGLGLSICKQIMEAHGGVLTADINEAGGLSVRLSLPAVKG